MIPTGAGNNDFSVEKLLVDFSLRTQLKNGKSIQ